MRKGFTLIELMIVVAIIAVIAAIAIPNLVESRMSANETAAVAACRAFLSAQNQFHRTDFYRNGFLSYALPYTHLYQPPGAAKPIKLIDLALSNAVIGNSKPRAGYYFDDITSDALDGAYDQSMDCGLAGCPAQWGRSGRSQFVIDVTGVVYVDVLEAEQAAPIKVFPDVSVGTDWIPVGSE